MVRTYLLSIRETADDKLWLLYMVTAKGWRPEKRVYDGKNNAVFDWVAFDAILEVFDLCSNSHGLSHRIHLPLRGILNDPLVYNRREAETGAWVLDVYRASLQYGP